MTKKIRMAVVSIGGVILFAGMAVLVSPHFYRQHQIEEDEKAWSIASAPGTPRMCIHRLRVYCNGETLRAHMDEARRLTVMREQEMTRQDESLWSVASKSGEPTEWLKRLDEYMSKSEKHAHVDEAREFCARNEAKVDEQAWAVASANASPIVRIGRLGEYISGAFDKLDASLVPMKIRKPVFEQEAIKIRGDLIWKHVQTLAQEGNADAQTFVGCCYLVGKYVARNSDSARSWLKKAKQNGSKEANEMLIAIYNDRQHRHGNGNLFPYSEEADEYSYNTWKGIDPVDSGYCGGQAGKINELETTLLLFITTGKGALEARDALDELKKLRK